MIHHRLTTNQKKTQHALIGRVGRKKCYFKKIIKMTFGIMSLRQTKPKWRCLSYCQYQIQLKLNAAYQHKHPAMSGMVVAGWWFGLVSVSTGLEQTSSDGVNHELICKPKYSGATWGCAAAEAWLELGRWRGRWSQTATKPQENGFPSCIPHGDEILWELCIKGRLQISMSWSNAVKKSGVNLHLQVNKTGKVIDN